MMMNKPSVLFVVSDFDMGGITTSLRNLTDVLIREGHRVGIVNLPKARQLPDSFHPDIELIPIKGRAVFWDLSSSDLKNSFGIKKIALCLLAFLKKITNRTGLWQKIIFHGIKIEGYEVAVAFRQSPLCYRFVKKHVNAHRRIGFWHGDPDYMDGVEKWIACLENVDYVACVSNAVRDAMKRKYPAYTEKYKTVYNVFRADEILQKSRLYKADYHENTVNLVTVTRIEFSQKQVQFIPNIASRLKEKGLRFHWTVVGDGPDYERLTQIIRQKQVSDVVTCVGNKTNPFPYVAQADLFVLTSRTEAHPMVLTESLILHTPCVAGYFPALPEVIRDGFNGLIAENSVEEIAEKITFLFTYQDFFDTLKKHVSQYQYSYRETYQLLMELCE